jgi:Domain of unknown function (DUF4124)
MGWLLSCAAPSTAWAQIYTCTDASGRKLTSDRPIAECLSKDQRELNPSGTVKRVIKPALTLQEQRIAEQKLQEENKEKERAAEERRKNRALMTRYPDKAAHDKERMLALSQVDAVIQAAQKRIGELSQQHKAIQEERAAYKNNPQPPALLRQQEDNERSVAIQMRFVADQEADKQRINARFDEELERLLKQWSPTAPAVGKAPAPTSAAPK